MDLNSEWMDKLKDMDLIENEKFEECANPELDDFLTELESELPADHSSLISVSSSSPSSFASSFSESIPESQMDNEGKEKCLNASEPLLLNTCDDKKQMNEVDFSQQNSDVKPVGITVGVDTKPRPSKLPTPLEKLTNCSTLTRSPVQDTRLECIIKELEELRTTDSAQGIQSSITNNDSQTSSGRSLSNDTYVISHGSSEERVPEALNESVTSEASSLGSSVSVESVTGNKKSRLPRTGLSIATKPVARTKLVKPSAKPSLLPSKVLDKTSKTLLHQPLSKSNGNKKLVKPVGTLAKSSKLWSLKQQENGGISRVASLNAAPRLTKKLPQNKSRLRKSSIPKPTAVSDLRKKQLSMDSSAELEATRVLKSTSELEATRVLKSTSELEATHVLKSTSELEATRILKSTSELEATRVLKSTSELETTHVLKSASELEATHVLKSASELEATHVLKSASEHVIQSTPIPVKSKTGTETGTTPSRKRADITETPTRNEGFGEGSRIRPSFSLSSIEDNAPAKSVSPAPPTRTAKRKTPKTATKRRSLLPTVGGKELAIPPLSFGTPAKKPRDVSQQQLSDSSPQLDDRQIMPPPKKSLKLRSGLQKSKAAPTRMAFKPRNGTKVKRDGPLKPNPLLYEDNSEMISTGGSKVVHSPVNKENMPSTPHSKWSPVKKKEFDGDDAFYKCTKRTSNAK